jgi:hypothetical protein
MKIKHIFLMLNLLVKKRKEEFQKIIKRDKNMIEILMIMSLLKFRHII